MPTFQTLKGVTYHAPQVLVDVQNELVEPSALEKSLAVFGDFPELKKGAVYTSVQGGAQVDEAYANIPSIRNYSKLWRQSIVDFEGQAQRLSFINCGTTSQAVYNIQSDADAAVLAGSFKSRYYGTKGNLLRVRLETPDTPTGNAAGIGLAATDNYYRVIASGSGQEQETFEFGKASVLSITYTDDSAQDQDGTITISDGTIRIQETTVDVSHSLSDFSTLDELKNAIEAASSKYSVIINRYDCEAGQLDEGVYAFNDDVAVNTPVTVAIHAHNRALEEGIANLGSAVPYEFSFADDRYRYLEPTAGNADAVPLQFEARDTDATQSSATIADYRGVFEDGVILGKDFTSCVVLDTQAAVHQLLKTYLEVSYQQQKERNAWVPAASNQSIDAVYGTYVRTLGSAQISVVAQDAIFSDYQNNRYVGDTKDMAFIAMAAHGALPFGAAATARPLQLIDTDEAWDRDQDKNKVAQKNIWGVALNDNNQRAVIRSLTSYVRDNLPQNNEVSVRESIDASSRDIRKFLSSQLGATITSSSVSKVSGLVTQRLKLHRDRAIIRGFENVQVSIVDDVVNISYDLHPTKSINFIRITARIRREFE